ncbi:flagellar biosynthesis anti-sigma factor FlgM [Fictibacillus sp. Mic-4]|uniref:flagellar biosynthesis anti-sigma factor FlgM n=1 Tax=Fictibacillus TaxID=1329200 RepID=UPI000420B2CD|nr:flagellar biosynthesis anti-sigma factor FlgM [Fictibacillus gelatini]
MKINHYNTVNLNPYRKQMNQSLKQKEDVTMQTDKLHISKEAKELQSSYLYETKRKERVQQIKEQVQSGTYVADIHETAQKFYKFWVN